MEDLFHMFKVIEDKALTLYLYAGRKLAELKGEAGQTSAEYIAVTAVAVLIAITVIYAAFNTQLSAAITNIGNELSTWVDSAFAGAPDPTPPPAP